MTTCANCQHPDKSLLSLLVLNGISRVTHRSSALFSSYSSSYSYILPSFPFYLLFLHCPPFPVLFLTHSSLAYIHERPTSKLFAHCTVFTVWTVFRLTAFAKNLNFIWSFDSVRHFSTQYQKNYHTTPSIILAYFVRFFQRYIFVSYLSLIYLKVLKCALKGLIKNLPSLVQRLSCIYQYHFIFTCQWGFHPNVTRMWMQNALLMYVWN